MTRVPPGLEVINITVHEGTGRTADSRFVTLDDLPGLDLGERPMLEYEMYVKGFSYLDAQGVARGFVRAKNPFEPSLIDVENRGIIESGGLGRNTYSIVAKVSK